MSSIERFERQSKRNYEKSLKESTNASGLTAKRQLEFETKDTDLVVDALLELSIPVYQESKENFNSRGIIMILLY